MTTKKFNAVAAKRLKECLKLMETTKAPEYQRGADRLSNFKRAAKMLQCTPERALVGMSAKHTTSVLDMVDDIERGELESLDLGVFQAKLTDSINYLLLLEALVLDRFSKED